ncbi:MAG: molybdopterin molybdotransferase MoeA [Chromatiales bacterium]|jgi:molybdopterin molybdotransferase|nr:molybdopterin molybdotransferase MoeA [Chromatiales bacterium]
MLPNCQGEDPNLLPVSIAHERINNALLPLQDTETVDLTDALGRVVAESVLSPANVPPHRNSAMDGYAVAGADIPREALRDLPVIGTAWAGRPFSGALLPGQAVRIMTGAKIPEGADTVIMQEQVEAHDDTIRIDDSHVLGQNVREAGEDIKHGETVINQGRRVGPAEMGLLASLGVSQVQVFRRLRVALFSTGDEVRDVVDNLDDGAIYDSNRYTLRGMLERLGVETLDMGVLPDDALIIRDALEKASACSDVLITSGGVSAGAADYVKDTLEALGQIGFWKIAIRPGRPLAFGAVGNAAFFGLPGNPVAVMVTFYQFAKPAIRTLSGEAEFPPEPTIDAVCGDRLRKKPGRIEYYRAILARDSKGELAVRPTGSTGSGLLHTMRDANCFIILEHDRSTVEPGDTVQVQPFYGLA